jgi:hypothetical protein
MTWLADHWLDVVGWGESFRPNGPRLVFVLDLGEQ